MTDLIRWLRDRLGEDREALRAWLGNLPADSGAADWIAQWLDDIGAKLRLLDTYSEARGWYDTHVDAPAGELEGLYTAIKLAALPLADRPGYREEWKP